MFATKIMQDIVVKQLKDLVVIPMAAHRAADGNIAHAIQSG
jgi:hypothetical protein